MIEHLNSDWKALLQNEFNKPYFKVLKGFIDSEYKNATCFPSKNQIFNAFNSCAFNDLKVVIIGQDPYHNYNQANGLCFSINEDIPFPPSLNNIFKEIETDLGVEAPNNGNLERWAIQGVFLLNATLTVRAHAAGSHQNKGWETFTDAIIKTISEKKETVIFLLWGGFAKKKIKLIDTKKHHVLQSGHPSPLSANRGYWFGNKHFSKTNVLLKTHKLNTINW